MVSRMIHKDTNKDTKKKYFTKKYLLQSKKVSLKGSISHKAKSHKDNERLKVMMFLDAFPPYTIPLANAVAEYCDVTFVIYKNAVRSDRFKIISPKIRQVVITKPRSSSIRSVGFTKKILSIIKDNDPDILHFQYGTPWFILIFPFLKKYTIITTMHDVVMHPGEENVWTSLNHSIMRENSDALIVHGKRLKNLMRKTFHYKKNIYVTLHGNYNILKAKKRFNEEKNWILFFGRIHKYKGLDYLIRSEPFIRKAVKDFKIVIAGEGDDIKPYKKIITDQGSSLKDFLIYNYHVSDNKMIELLQKSSIIVLPYIEASQSGVLPLAYQFNKPVITTDVGSLSEVVKNGKTGLLIPPKNVKRLADAIIYMLKNPIKRRDMGIRGHEFSMKELSWDHIAQKTIECYEKELKIKKRIGNREKN